MLNDYIKFYNKLEILVFNCLEILLVYTLNDHDNYKQQGYNL